MMSMMVNAAAGVAALNGTLAWSRASESQQRFTQRGTDVECAVQPEATSRHKGDCGR
ncbi:hypothetical protein P3T22_005540 [Paraburkholderia sp. GAS348]